MGTAASIPIQRPKIDTTEFTIEEQLCRDRFYFSNFDMYVKRMEAAVSNNNLDIIELLIPSGDAKKAFPLHIGCGNKHEKV